MQGDHSEKAAGNDDLGSQRALGALYRGRSGIAADYAEAAYRLRIAADRGLAEAQYHMGWLHELGRGVTEDQEQAIVWYKQAERQGHAGARVRLDALAVPDQVSKGSEPSTRLSESR